jgi:hypothetical protein
LEDKIRQQQQQQQQYVVRVRSTYLEVASPFWHNGYQVLRLYPSPIIMSSIPGLEVDRYWGNQIPTNSGILNDIMMEMIEWHSYPAIINGDNW